jgi:hypothetical protein
MLIQAAAHDRQLSAIGAEGASERSVVEHVHLPGLVR